MKVNKTVAKIALSLAYGAVAGFLLKLEAETQKRIDSHYDTTSTEN